jgi:transposase
VTATPVGSRVIRGAPLGSKPFDLNVQMHRLRCHSCGAFRMEKLDFLPSSHAHITRALERTIVELRPEMSISAVASYFGLPWETVKNAEKAHLERKYRTIRLKEVTTIGIDEIHVGHNKYKTIVRDLEHGHVLHVGDGKGGDALKKFWRRLSSSKATIEAVAMDMSNGYASWVRKKLPNAEIVFDHFHVIKLMNDRVDKVRRRTVSSLEDDEKKALKKKRFLLLKNEEDLDQDAHAELTKLRETFSDLGTASAMKESLRNIYTLCPDSYTAENSFVEWCAKAEASGIAELKSMAKTVRSHLQGILAYWRRGKLTSAGMEGFNNKIRWLIRQAYGYRDDPYFVLKIFDLPNIKTERKL